MNEYEIKIGSATAPAYRFSNADIISIDRINTVDLVTEQLSVDEFRPHAFYVRYDAEAFAPSDYDLIVTSDNKVFCTNREYGDIRLLHYGTPIFFYKDGILIGKYYSQSVKRVSRFEYELNCISAIGLFDTQDYVGRMCEGETFEEIATDIIGGTVPFSCEEDVKNTAIYNWIPYGTKRQALQELMFVTSATLTKDANGDIKFSYIYSSSPTVIPDEKVYNEGEVDYGSPASGVRVTEHSFIANATDEEVTVFDNIESGETADHKLIVFQDAPLHDLVVADGITIHSSNCNYAIVSGIGTLTGKKYTHLTNVVEKNVLTNGEQKIITVTDAYLVSAINSENVANRLMSYYSSRKVIKSSIVLTDEQCGRKVQITDPYDLTSTDGYISKMDIVSSGIEKASCEIITDYVPQGQGNAYTDSVLLTGSGTWQIPQSVFEKPNPIIKAILIGGGQGAQSSGASSAGENGAVNHSGNGGEGGEIGDSGEGGKILAVTIDCTGLTSIAYNCGARGEGGVPSGTQPHDGSLGGDTTIVAGDTSYNSANGVSNVNGYQNIFTGEVYARKGTQDAVKGGKGGQSDARTGEGYPAESVSANGQTWQGGQQGTLKYDGTYYAGGGGGSGAVRGHNGLSGQDGSSGGSAGNGANGLTPARRADASVIGQGGSATDSPSGGGGGGATSRESYWESERYYGLGGASAQGQYGARGGIGGVLFYI